MSPWTGHGTMIIMNGPSSTVLDTCDPLGLNTLSDLHIYMVDANVMIGFLDV